MYIQAASITVRDVTVETSTSKFVRAHLLSFCASWGGCDIIMRRWHCLAVSESHDHMLTSPCPLLSAHRALSRTL